MTLKRSALFVSMFLSVTNFFQGIRFLEKKPLMGTFANSEDPDGMLQNVTFHQGLHCLLLNKMDLQKKRNSIIIKLIFLRLKPINGYFLQNKNQKGKKLNNQVLNCHYKVNNIQSDLKETSYEPQCEKTCLRGFANNICANVQSDQRLCYSLNGKIHI